MESKYHRVWFTNGKEKTAGLVLSDIQVSKGIDYISRLFPYSEATKMKVLVISDPYESQSAALRAEFNEFFKGGE